MANKKFTGLPSASASALTDVIAVAQSGTSKKETLQQVFNLMLANVILNYAGNPNGNVAGVVYQLCWDSANNVLYVCETSGNAASAVWTVTGSGDVVGPGSSTNNAIAKFSGTTGNLLENSNIIIQDSTNFLGINTSSPAFSIDASDGIIARGTIGSGSVFPTGYVGTSFSYSPNESALRIGQVIGGNIWDPSNVGQYSVSIGYNTVATGLSSMAFGTDATTTSQGILSLSFGYSTVASGLYSFAFGNTAIAAGNNSIAFSGSTANGLSDMAFINSVIDYTSIDKTVLGGNTAFNSNLFDTTNSFAYNSSITGYSNNFALNSTIVNTDDSGLNGNNVAFNSSGLHSLLGKNNFLVNCIATNTRLHGQNIFLGDNGTQTDTTGGFFANTNTNTVDSATFGITGFAMIATDNCLVQCDNGNYITVIGGSSHYISAAQYSHIWGGHNNDVENSFATAIGGEANQALALYSFVAGSSSVASGENAIAMGASATASGIQSVCLGGYTGVAGGAGSVCIGGYENSVTGNGSVALGGNHISIATSNSYGFGEATQIQNDSCFVFCDSSGALITSVDNQVMFGAQGGFYINTNNPIAGFYFAQGSGPGTFLFSASGSISSGSMGNYEVNPYVSTDDLHFQYKGSTGTAFDINMSTIAGLTPINDSVLIADGSAVTSFSQTLPTAVQANIGQVGTLTDLTVTNPITGSVTGNAATVTTNANLTGPITSLGNATTIANSINLPASPTTTTQTPNDNSTKISTTAYVDAAIAANTVAPFTQALLATIAALPTSTYSNGTLGVGATITGTSTGLLTVDGTTASGRILVKDQVLTFQNGIYTVTVNAGGSNFILTRATDADQSAEIISGKPIFVSGGSSLQSTTWAVNSASSPTMGTSAITFTQTAGPAAFTAGNGISIVANQIAIDTAVTVDKTTTQTLTGKVLTGNTAVNLISGSGTITFNTSGTITVPNGTDTLVGKATTDTFTNKTFNTAGTGNLFSINGTSITSVSGSGAVALVSGSTFIGPILGAATATSINGLTLTSSTGTLTIANLKTLTASNTLTFTGTDGSSVAFGTGGTVAYVGGALGAASATSLTITGTSGNGYLELQTQGSAPTLSATNSLRMYSNSTGMLAWTQQNDLKIRNISSTLTAHRTYTLPDADGTFTLLGNTSTGSGDVVLATSPTLITPVLGVATATSINKLTITSPATSAVLTIANGKTLTASNTLTFTGTDTSSVAFGTGGTVAYVGGTLGAITVTSINGLTISTTTGTLTIANGKTLTASNTLTLTGTNGSSIDFGAGGTAAYLSNTLGDFSATTSAQLKAVMSDETGSGSLVFATNPVFSTPTTDSINVVGTAGAGFLQLNTQSGATSAGNASSVRIFSDSNGRFCWLPQTDGFIRRFDGVLTSNRIITWPDSAGTVTLLGNSSTGSGSVVLDTNAALTTPTFSSANIIGTGGAGFLQMNSQSAGPGTGNANSIRLYSTSGGILAWTQQNDGFTRFFGGTFTANRTITFQDKTGTVYVTGGTNVAVADGGTGAGTAAAARTNLGINIDSARNYSDHTSLGLGTARTPSTTNDTYVVAVVSITEANGNQGSASAVIDGTTTIASVLLNHATVAAGTLKISGTMSFICPANSSYTISSAGGGTRTLESIYELTM